MLTDVDAEGILQSQLWIDQPDWEVRLERKLADGEVTLEDAELLTQFAQDGFCRFSLKNADAAICAVSQGFDVLWEQRPNDLLGAAVGINEGRPMPLSLFPRPFVRGPGTRLLDVHGHGDAARSLYLNAQLHRIVGLILGSAPVATQSLCFEYGSTQPLHRDPWYVVTRPVWTLLAAWIALEDIRPDSGPLMYVPGSHHLPFHVFRNGGIVMHAPGVSPQERSAAMQHMIRQIEHAKLNPQPFLAQRGDVFIWHGALVHGGSPVKDPSLTRKSLVVHFDDLASHPRRGASVRYPNGEGSTVYTDELIGDSGAIGFQSPLRSVSSRRYGDVIATRRKHVHLGEAKK